MEARKITIVSTKNQTKKVIMSSATTLAELKSDLRQNNIDYEGMTFFEGTSKVELKNDNSVLPHDVPWKGNITNELVFMLTNTNKKIKSGVMSRLEAYTAIRNMKLQDDCIKRFGKNFTMCKTVDLVALVEEASKVEKNINTPTPEETLEPLVQYKDCVDIKAREAIHRIVEILERNEAIDEYEKEEVLGILNRVDSEKNPKEDMKSSYSNDEIDDMFADMDV